MLRVPYQSQLKVVIISKTISDAIFNIFIGGGPSLCTEMTQVSLAIYLIAVIFNIRVVGDCEFVVAKQIISYNVNQAFIYPLNLVLYNTNTYELCI